MKANKKVMLGAALVVAIVALAGVGYAAATGYKSTTTVDANTVADSQYIVITLGDDASKYTAQITGTYAYDTVNTAGSVTFGNCYEVTDGAIDSDNPETKIASIFNYADGAFTKVASGGAYDGVVIGETITVAFSDDHSANKALSLTIAAAADNPGTFTQGTNTNVSLVLTYKVGEGAETVFAIGDSINANAADTIHIQAYLVTPHAGQTVSAIEAGDNAVMTNYKLSFTAVVTGAGA